MIFRPTTFLTALYMLGWFVVDSQTQVTLETASTVLKCAIADSPCFDPDHPLHEAFCDEIAASVGGFDADLKKPLTAVETDPAIFPIEETTNSEDLFVRRELNSCSWACAGNDPMYCYFYCGGARRNLRGERELEVKTKEAVVAAIINRFEGPQVTQSLDECFLSRNMKCEITYEK